jgi:Domain of unknown function (DUF4259)
MGTWGAGIFDDDTAMDVRDSFEGALEQGLSASDAAARIREEYADDIGDEDDGPVVWLALASLQVKHGALQPEVKGRALEIIERGEGLERWQEADEEVFAARQQVLADLLRSLQTAAPYEGS